MMKRTCLISSTLALLTLAPSVASAEPGILYIPTEDVTLFPNDMAPCGSASNSATGCGGADAETVVAPYADAEALGTAMGDALLDFDVMVTHARPPEYISYTMLMPSDEVAAMGVSFTCTSGAISCGARARNRMLFTSGGTANCMDPEITHAALYAFGRVSGLEGIDNPEDYMNYVPDYTVPPLGYQDLCSDRVNQLAINDMGDVVMQLLECTSLDHTDCPDGMNGEPQQNSYQDLLSYYGTRVEDADAPELTNVVPEDGAVLMQGDPLVIDVDIADADPIVGVRWTVTSPALMDLIGQETFSQCTNDVCDANWEDTPFKTTDSDWSVTFAGLPAADYAITLEAADYHGNVTEMVSYTVTIMADDSGTSGVDTGNVETGNDETAGNATNAFTTGNDESGDGTSTSSQDDTGGGGCSCRTTPAPGSAVLMLLGLMGLGTMRRRW